MLFRSERINQSRWKALLVEPPDVLVVVNHSTNYLSPTYPEFNVIERQVEETTRVLRELSRLRIPTVFQIQIPNCMGRPTLLDREWTCRESTKLADARRDFERELARKISLFSLGNVILLNMNAEICSSSGCRGFRSGVSVFADESHLTPSESRRLAPRYREAIDLALRMRTSE